MEQNWWQDTENTEDTEVIAANIFAAPSFPGQHANCKACQDLVMISINYSPAGVGWPGSATETQRARIAIFATKTIG